MLVMLANNHIKDAFLLCNPSDHVARGVPAQDTLVVDNDESIPKQEWMPQTQTGRGEFFCMISPVPSNIDLSTPPPRPPSNGHLTPQPERSDYLANGGWQWQEDIKARANCHPWDSNAKLEDLFCSNKKAILLLILNFDSSELTLLPFLEPSQYNEPPIPGLSQSSKSQVPSHEDALTHEPEPEVAPMQSTEDPFGNFPLSFCSCFQHSLTPPLTISSSSHYPRSVIIIDNMSVCSPEIPPIAPESPTACSPHSHDEASQEFTNLRPTLMIPQAIVNKSINRILLEHF
ncbi:hypothetical protein O181_114624 [Austropuccinia psidii MF-1]|uniref:Uncharacterized protein n=1 Tax=Austropuccinia psidii MF-1 TaxID=1389203 RepID=A0A9Q3PUT5_9BASI|nr:hypothetical protein [Austropuccinia psidii MF-1]